MTLSEVRQHLLKRLSLPLPGTQAQLRMASVERRNNLDRYQPLDTARQSGVLILFYEKNNQIYFPLIRRPVYNGVHSGQIGLPGGRFEEGDKDLFETALRENEEETGISRSFVEVLGSLTQLYIPPSNSLVTPVIGLLGLPPQFIPNPFEVDEIIEMELDKILDEALIKEKVMTFSNGVTSTTPYFSCDDHVIWGATAMILAELKEVMR